MPGDRTPGLTDDEIEAFREAVEELRDAVRTDLAADFGGDPEEYRADASITDRSDR